VLVQSVLLEELQRFADPAASVFAGWPIGKPDARRRWAHAFAQYVDDMEDTAPVLTPHGHTLSFAAVEDAFFNSLGLSNANIADAATDFADAWTAGIAALVADQPASDPSSTPFTFAAMDPLAVTARRLALIADLVTAFTERQSTRIADLDEIAAAFHTATTGLTSTLTPYVVTYG
jgi:hypothetical protein